VAQLVIHTADDDFGGAPVQVEGTLDGVPFYFRARGNRCYFEAGDFYYEEFDYSELFIMSWITVERAKQIIQRAVSKYEELT